MTNLASIWFLFSFSATSLSAQILGGAHYTNSWIGNNSGIPQNSIPHNTAAFSVSPSGNLATITNWDEGGKNVAIYGPTGAKVGIPTDSGTGSWGRISGEAVFLDDSYLYQSMSQQGGYEADEHKYPADSNVSWKCVRRFNIDGSNASFPGGKGYDGAMLVIATNSSEILPSGIVILNNELYVSEPFSGQIKVYNASTMSSIPLRSFAIAHPGLLDRDRLGFIWMLDKVQKKLVRFNTGGVLQSQAVDFPSGVIPKGFCLDRVNDRILVTNSGIDQNILVYTNIFTTPIQPATFGATGGIHSGVAGAIAPLKFSEPSGVRIDSGGNIFVGNNGVNQGGGRYEKYNSAGVLQWRLNGLIFTSVGEVNPSDETEFYTHEFKYYLNLASIVPGTEWSPAAMTLNKFKYPTDPRIFLPNEGNRIRATTYVRSIAGKKIIYVTDMYGSFLAFYRFNATTDGEIAIPSGSFENGSPESLWCDANGNGINNSGETQSALGQLYTQQYFPDANGGIWKASREGGVRYYPLQGFDVHGSPIYNLANSVAYALPDLVDIRRVSYDVTNDVLYAAGASADGILGGDWGVAGDKLVAYTRFLGNRSVAWNLALPFTPNSPNSNNVKGFCEAGDFIFLAASTEGRVYVHRKLDGSKVGEILPTSDTGFRSGWSDIMNPILARKRTNGEYLIFVEENLNGKVMMYRWHPLNIAPPPFHLTGIIIGTMGSWSNNGSTRENAFDGDTSSYFDAQNGSGNWVGLDLGSELQIRSLRYHPRRNQANRLNGGIFQGSNTADFSSGVINFYTISGTPPEAFTSVAISNTVRFRYVRYLAPDDSHGNIAEIEFFQNPTALSSFRTAHGLTADGSQDLLTPANDGVQNILKFAFNMIGTSTGQVAEITIPNINVLTVNGNSGLPTASMNSLGKLQGNYIRRKATSNRGISYAVEFCNDLSSGSWAVNGSATTAVTSLDTTFERVTVTDNLSQTKRFVRVKVTAQ